MDVIGRPRAALCALFIHASGAGSRSISHSVLPPDPSHSAGLFAIRFRWLCRGLAAALLVLMSAPGAEAQRTPFLSGSTGTVAEGGSATFTVGFSGPAKTVNEDVTVVLKFPNSNPAKYGKDYKLLCPEQLKKDCRYDDHDTGLNLEVPFTDGDPASAEITIAALSDEEEDDGEAVSFSVVQLNHSGSGEFGLGGKKGQTGKFIIKDSGSSTPEASFSAASSSAGEDAGTSNVRVSLSPAPQSAITLAYTVGGTATSGMDYKALSGTVSASSGATSVSIPVEIVDDSADESDETVVLTLTAGSGYTLGSAKVHTLAIADDDGGGGGGFGGRGSGSSGALPAAAPAVPSVPAVRITGGDAVTEGGEAAFTLAAEPAPAADLEVRISVADAPGAGFVAAGDEGIRTVTIPSGSSEAAFAVATEDDGADEPDGPVKATLLPGDGYAPGDPAAASVDVTDDDVPEASFASAASGAAENAGTHPVEIMLDPVPASDISLRYTVGGTATPGADYAALSGTVTAKAGRASVAVPIEIVDDALEDDGETVVLTLAAGTGYGLGVTRTHTLTVSNDDGASMPPRRPGPDGADLSAVDAAVVRFGRTLGERTASAVRDRLRATRDPGLDARLAGRTLAARRSGPERETADATPYGTEIEAWLKADGAPRGVTRAEMLEGAGFGFAGLTDSGAALAVWGRGSLSGFAGRESLLSLDGEVASLQFGADWGLNGRAFGVMLSRSLGDIGYAGASSGRVRTDMTAIVPYFGAELPNGLSAWGALGAGRGSVTAAPEGGIARRAGLGWRMAAGGVEGDVDLEGFAILPGAAVGWSADALWTRTSPDAGLPATGGEASRLRLALNASWERRPAWGGLLEPRMELGLRRDGGDAETGLGIEAAAGFVWTDPKRGLRLSLEARTLALHEAGGFRDWGLGATLAWDPRPHTKRGFSAGLSGSLGEASSGGAMSLMNAATLPEAAEASGGSWAAEMAWGAGRGRGMVGSAYVAANGSGGTEPARMGYRIGPDAEHAEDATLDIWAGPQDGRGSVGASLRWRW